MFLTSLVPFPARMMGIFRTPEFSSDPLKVVKDENVHISLNLLQVEVFMAERNIWRIIGSV